MNVRVRLFAAAKDLADRDVVELQVGDGATIADVRTALVANVPAIAHIVRHALWAVDTQYAADTTNISTNSEIALIPPVSGG